MSNDGRREADSGLAQGLDMTESLFAAAFVADNLSRLADARRELVALQLAETRVREIQGEAMLGVLPDFGTTSGEFEPPNDDLAWQLDIEPFALPVPPELQGRELPPDSLFASDTGRRLQQGEQDPRPRLVRMRVHGIDVDPDSVDPFVAVLTPPLDVELPAEQTGAETVPDREAER